MVELKTEFDGVEVHKSGSSFIKLYLIVEVNGNVVSKVPNRVTVGQDEDEAVKLSEAEVVNARSGFPGVGEPERQQIMRAFKAIRG